MSSNATEPDIVGKIEDDFIASLTEEQMRKGIKEIFQLQNYAAQRYRDAETAHYLKDYFLGMATGLDDVLTRLGFK